MNVHALVKTAKIFLKTHETGIRKGVNIGTMITVSVLSARAAIKSKEEIDQRKAESPTGEIETKEKALIIVKHSIPVAGAIAFGIYGIEKQDNPKNKIISGLANTVQLAETSLDDYKKKVAEEIGQEKADSIDKKIFEDQIIKMGVPARSSGPSNRLAEEGWMVEGFTGQVFWSSRLDVKDAAIKFNHIVQNEYPNCASFKEWLDEIGIDITDSSIKEYYESVGYNEGHLLDLRFVPGVNPIDDSTCWKIEYTSAGKPIPDYLPFVSDSNPRSRYY